MYCVAAVGPTGLRQIRNAVIDVQLHGGHQEPRRDIKRTIGVINEALHKRKIAKNVASGNCAITSV